MHRASDFQVAKQLRNCHKINWDSSVKSESLEQWLERQPVDTWKKFFDENGYLVIENLITEEEVEIYKNVYDKMLSSQIDTKDHRHDLGNHDEQKTEAENITQIMWPSLYVQDMEEGPLHVRVQAVANKIVGADAAFDYDMLIYKAPHTDTETPWHQDESYWPDLSDKRAASFWVSLDHATVENGCMWFVPGSHKHPLRKHRQAKEGCHVLMCDCSNDEGKPIPLKPGSCTIHSGRTLHHTEGNTTDNKRRAYIVNWRPQSMVEQERQLGFDHAMTGLGNLLEADKHFVSD